MKKLIIMMVLVAMSATLLAQVPFTKGNIVVLRMGDGTNTYDLTKSNGAPFFLDEYKVEDLTATLVQSVSLPTVVNGLNKRCIASPSSTNSHGMTRSADGRFLVVPGFDGSLGVSPWGQQASVNNRVVALVNSNAGINTTTALTNVFNTKDHRSATSYDGTDIWVSGNYSNSNDGGVFYTQVGGTTGTRINSTVPRYVRIYGGQLYVSVQQRIYAAGTGMPKTNANYTDLTDVPNSGDQAVDGYGFYIDDLDPANPGTKKVMYFGDVNKIKKYSLVNDVWKLDGEINTTDPNKTYSIEGKVENGVVKLYFVTRPNSFGGGGGKIWAVEDASGYNTAPNPAMAIPDLLVDYSGTNKAITSVAWAPEAVSILPVKLTSFNAQKLQNAVRLSWSTSSENHNSHYEVLRSDGNDWEVIGKVMGNGTTNQNNSYSFTDSKPLLGVSYYQLRQVDFDGKSELSKIIPVKIDMLVSGLSVLASADKQQVQLTFNAEKAGQSNIIISNVIGQKIAQSVKHAEKGLNNFIVPVRLKKGVYVATISINGVKQVSKFIVE